MSIQRISELEHATGQVLPCSWDACPVCRNITVTVIRPNEKLAAALRAYPWDGSLIDLSGPEFYDRTTRQWWE